MARHRHRRHRRRNPGVVSRFTGVLPLVGYGIVGGIASQSIPDMLLGKSNTGWMGYLANAATAVGVSMLGGSVLGTVAAEGLLIGGAIQTISRVVGDLMGRSLVQFSPLKGYGRLNYALPSYTPGLSYALPAAVAPVAMAGMGVYGRTFRGRTRFAA